MYVVSDDNGGLSPDSSHATDIVFFAPPANEDPALGVVNWTSAEANWARTARRNRNRFSMAVAS